LGFFLGNVSVVGKNRCQYTAQMLHFFLSHFVFLLSDIYHGFQIEIPVLWAGQRSRRRGSEIQAGSSSNLAPPNGDA
jgi:hypothetical protein